jgi:hypothetical protein
MQISLAILTMAVTALCAPVEKHTQNDIILTIPRFEARATAAGMCDANVCTTLAKQCIKSCDSIANGDWYVAFDDRVRSLLTKLKFHVQHQSLLRILCCDNRRLFLGR